MSDIRTQVNSVEIHAPELQNPSMYTYDVAAYMAIDSDGPTGDWVCIECMNSQINEGLHDWEEVGNSDRYTVMTRDTEVDYPSACSECDILLDHRLTGDGDKYVMDRSNGFGFIAVWDYYSVDYENILRGEIMDATHSMREDIEPGDTLECTKSIKLHDATVIVEVYASIENSVLDTDVYVNVHHYDGHDDEPYKSASVTNPTV